MSDEMTQPPADVRERVLTVLTAIEWAAQVDHPDGGWYACCPWCEGGDPDDDETPPGRAGHAELCELAAVLALLRTPRGEGTVRREALSAALDKASESQTRQGRCRPGQNGGLAAIFGQWPGDETDEEIEAALAEMERCHCGGDAEIARLTRELEEARERERAVRDEATGYLAEVAETLADMHYGEECSFEGGEGCLACYAQDRIAEMQDALAATPDTRNHPTSPLRSPQ